MDQKQHQRWLSLTRQQLRDVALLSEGERNNGLYAAARRAARDAGELGVDRRDVEAHMQALADAAADAGLDSGEAASAVRSASRADVEAAGPTGPIVEPRNRPPRRELLDWWGQGKSVFTGGWHHNRDSHWAAPTAYLKWRGYSLHELHRTEMVRILPGGWYRRPAWWPVEWWPWSIAILAYDHRGRAASMHARCSTAGAMPKTRWPKGYSAKGLLFADSGGLALLRGTASRRRAVIVTEGLTDTLTAACKCLDEYPDHCVIGVASGSASAFKDGPWYRATKGIFIAVDGDRAGKRYCDIIRSNCSSAKIKRIKF